MSTSRRILFTEDEIKDALKNIPESITIGAGAEQRVMKHRKIEDPEPPLFETGPTGTVVSEDIYLETMVSFAQEDHIDAIGSGSLRTFRGQEIRVGSPLEIRAAVTIAIFIPAFLSFSTTYLASGLNFAFSKIDSSVDL